jgi:hypothetical protein
MYLQGDISNTLKNKHPNLVMTLMNLKSKKLPIKTIEHKILLGKAWCRAGRPSTHLDKLKEYLGEYWEAYTHPTTQKLHSLTLKEILLNEDFTSLTEDHRPIVKNILHDKLNDHLEYEGVTALAVHRSFPIKTKSHKLMVYQLKSKYVDKSIIKVSFEWIGFKYSVKVIFLDLGYVEGAVPSEDSQKNIKKLMYEITDEWNIKDIDGAVDLLRFDNVVLDSLTENIKHYINEAKK